MHDRIGEMMWLGLAKRRRSKSVIGPTSRSAPYSLQKTLSPESASMMTLGCSLAMQTAAEEAKCRK